MRATTLKQISDRTVTVRVRREYLYSSGIDITKIGCLPHPEGFYIVDTLNGRSIEMLIVGWLGETEHGKECVLGTMVRYCENNGPIKECEDHNHLKLCKLPDRRVYFEGAYKHPVKVEIV